MTTTMIIALVTILVKGGFTIRMLEILSIETGVDAQPFADKVSQSVSLEEEEGDGRKGMIGFIFVREKGKTY